MPYDVTTGTYTYNIGDLLRIQATFKNLSGVNVDPTNVTLKVKNPAGTVTTYTYPTNVQRNGTGVFYYDYLVQASGVHYFNWAGTGAYTAADEASFTVVTTVFP